jgi:hypothetical protein
MMKAFKSVIKLPVPFVEGRVAVDEGAGRVKSTEGTLPVFVTITPSLLFTAYTNLPRNMTRYVRVTRFSLSDDLSPFHGKLQRIFSGTYLNLISLGWGAIYNCTSKLTNGSLRTYEYLMNRVLLKMK